VDLRQRLSGAHDYAEAGAGSAEPYVLLIGEALEYKGIHCLLEALNPGPLLRIAGNLAVGGADWLIREYPKARVTWEPSWIARSRLDELVAGAAVIAFPYLAGFDSHGGVSGALVHALTAGKPVVISTALASQAPQAPSCRVVNCGDARELRQAIDWAMANSACLHQAARDLEAYLIREHTYEQHVHRMAERLSEGD
jgi:glycosyltransferase involved in cell wall biosynthesis